MTFILIIAVVVVVGLIALSNVKGVENALPFLAFWLVVLPIDVGIQFPGIVDVTVQRIAIATIAILWVLLRGDSSAQVGKRSVPLGYLLLLQLFWGFVSTANSTVFLVSLKSTISFALEFFLLYYIIVKTVSRVETIHKMIGAVFAAMVVCSVLGYCEAYYFFSVMDYVPHFAHRFGAGEGLYTDLSRGVRVRSTFIHPILFGAALSMAIPWGFYLLTLAESRLRKVILWAGLMLMFVSIYKTASRGAWLAVVIALAVMSLLTTIEMRKRLLIVVVLSVSVLIVRPGVWETIRNTYANTVDPNDNSGQHDSYQWRYILLDVAAETVGKSLGREMWGYGPESFFYLGLQTEVDGRPVKVDSCDSSVAELIIDTGYLGLFFSGLVFGRAAFIALKDSRRLPEPHNQLSLIVFVNIATFCFLMTNVAIYGWGQQNHMLWIVIALGMTTGDLVRRGILVEQYQGSSRPQDFGDRLQELPGLEVTSHPQGTLDRAEGMCHAERSL